MHLGPERRVFIVQRPLVELWSSHELSAIAVVGVMLYIFLIALWMSVHRSACSNFCTQAESEEARKGRVADEAYMGYMADYLTQRICMLDETGAQRDHSQPGVDGDSAVPGDSGENKMNANIENQGGDGNEQVGTREKSLRFASLLPMKSATPIHRRIVYDNSDESVVPHDRLRGPLLKREHETHVANCSHRTGASSFITKDSEVLYHQSTTHGYAC